MVMFVAERKYALFGQSIFKEIKIKLNIAHKITRKITKKKKKK
jgi:hypothetical protein